MHVYRISIGLLFLLLFGNCSIKLWAQLPDYHLQVFDHASGIRPGNNLAITKDAKGFLWILYPRNVQRFDGRQASSFKAGTDQHQVFADEAGGIWVSSPKKIFRFNEAAAAFSEVPMLVADTAVVFGQVFQLKGKDVYVNSNAGFFRFDSGQSIFIPVFRDIPIDPPYHTRAFSAKGNSLFFGGGTQLYRYRTDRKTLDSLPGANMRRLFAISEDSVLMSTWSLHAFWYDFKSRVTLPIPVPNGAADPNTENGSMNFGVRSIVQVAANRFFLSSNRGLFEYNDLSRQYKRVQLHLRGKPVLSADYTNFLYLDKEPYLWMTTVDGIARIPVNGQSFGLIRIRQNEAAIPAGIDNIRNITGDKDGNLWLASGNGFIEWRRKTNEWKIHLPKEGSTHSLAFPSIRGIAHDGRYLILAPTDLGIWLYDPGKDRFRRPVYTSPGIQQKSESDFFDAITSLRDGNHLLLGRDHLYRLDGKTYALTLVETPASHENTNFACQDKNGIVWLSSNKGLHLLDSNLNYLQKVILPTVHPVISAGVVLTDNRFLFALDSGLYTASVKAGNVEVVNFTRLLDDAFITAVLQDNDGIIWATSENGIYRYDPVKAKLYLFDYTDNIQGYGFNYNSWYKAADGMLFLGGTNGLNYIQPHNFSARKDQLKVYIKHFKGGSSDSLQYTLDKPLLLRYRDRSFEVSFEAPYFNNHEKLKYRYQLKGLDKDWIYSGNSQSIRYSSVPPGSYTLLVEASTNAVDWIAADKHLKVNVRSPFWMSPWFIASMFLLLATAVWLVIRNRNRKIAEQQEELEAEQAINYFSNSMVEYSSVEQILWDVARNCIGRLQFEDCVIYLIDEKRQVLLQKAAHGPKSPLHFEIRQPLEIPVGKGITGAVAKSGKAEIIADTSKDPRYIVDDQSRLSEITVPIAAGGKVLGVIDCEHSKKSFFTQKHLSILSTIASLCANKIVKAKAEAEKLEAEKNLMATQQQMAEVEMQALRAQMNPHFIFNSLNSINRYIVKSDQATASLYLTRFAKLIRLILDNSNSRSVPLTNELEALKLYLEMESIRFEKKFSYEIRLDGALRPDNNFIPPMIIQPYVENAIWHGLLHMDNAGHLAIDLTLGANNVLACVIEDNGIGREKARQMKSKSAATRKSLGMKLTEDRLILLNKQTHLEASVTIVDLVDDQGEAAGTKVILKIPLDN